MGAGTVLTVEQVRAVHAAGGHMVISPNFNPLVVAETLKLGMLSLPGVFAGCLIVFVMALGFYITPAILGGGRVVMIAEFITVLPPRQRPCIEGIIAEPWIRRRPPSQK